MHPFVVGARLVVFCQNDGGTHPIAVGTILQKVVSQCIADSIKEQLPSVFAPHRFGVELPCGGEKIEHGLRFQQILNLVHVLVSVDFFQRVQHRGPGDNCTTSQAMLRRDEQLVRPV